jgi:translation elongation factor EF-Ts
LRESKKQVLLDQEYIRDPNITVDEYIKQVVGILGENIRVARFTRCGRNRLKKSCALFTCFYLIKTCK